MCYLKLTKNTNTNKYAKLDKLEVSLLIYYIVRTFILINMLCMRVMNGIVSDSSCHKREEFVTLSHHNQQADFSSTTLVVYAMFAATYLA